MDPNSDDYLQRLHYICQQIRIDVEKSVEDTLLNSIVLRYRQSVQTLGRIMWLSQVTIEDCRMIDKMITKYSYYDHSMSDEAPLCEFELDEVIADVTEFRGWLSSIKKRIDQSKNIR